VPHLHTQLAQQACRHHVHIHDRTTTSTTLQESNAKIAKKSVNFEVRPDVKEFIVDVQEHMQMSLPESGHVQDAADPGDALSALGDKEHDTDYSPTLIPTEVSSSGEEDAVDEFVAKHDLASAETFNPAPGGSSSGEMRAKEEAKPPADVAAHVPRSPSSPSWGVSNEAGDRYKHSQQHRHHHPHSPLSWPQRSVEA